MSMVSDEPSGFASPSFKLAKAIYNDTPELKTAEITGRKGDMQINLDGTKTMETGGEKMCIKLHEY
jgi:hypothetical protein